MRWPIALCVLSISGIAAADPISLRVANPTRDADTFPLAERPVIESAVLPAGLARPTGFNDRWAAFAPRMPWRSVWAGVDVGATAQLAESVGAVLAGRPAQYALVVPVSTLVIYGVHRLTAER